MSSTLIMQQLQEPFPPEDIEWRVGSTNQEKTKGIALAYVTNRAIMNRLDNIFGPFGWKNEFREWKNNSQLCGISIRFGDEWITKWDGADDSQTEAVKGGLSDAMKRAGYQWGIGRYLYNLENQWVPIKPAGKSYALVEEPKLPKWALPEGYEYPKQSAPKDPPKDAQKETTPQITLSKLIGFIKTEWMTKGYHMNKIDEQCEKLYQRKLAELDIQNAQDFLQKCKQLPKKESKPA